MTDLEQALRPRYFYLTEYSVKGGKVCRDYDQSEIRSENFATECQSVTNICQKIETIGRNVNFDQSISVVISIFGWKYLKIRSEFLSENASFPVVTS